MSAGVNLFGHFGGRVPEHLLGSDVEDSDDPLWVRGDAGEVGAAEDRSLQRARFDQGFRKRGTSGREGPPPYAFVLAGEHACPISVAGADGRSPETGLWPMPQQQA